MKRNIISIILLLVFISCTDPYESSQILEIWSVGAVNKLPNPIYVIVEFKGYSSQILFIEPEKIVFTDDVSLGLTKNESLNAGGGIYKISIIDEFQTMPIILEKEQINEYLFRRKREITIDDVLEDREYDVIEFILEVTEDLKELVE